MHSQFLIYFNHPSAAAGRLNGSGTVWQVWVASNAIRRRPYHLPSIFIEIQLPHISFVLLLLLLLKYGSVHVNFQITLPAFRMGLHLPSSPPHRPIETPEELVTASDPPGKLVLSAYALITRYIRTDHATCTAPFFGPSQWARIFRSHNWYFGSYASVLDERFVLRNNRNASRILNASPGCGPSFGWLFMLQLLYFLTYTKFINA